jgi:hypothetical protein
MSEAGATPKDQEEFVKQAQASGMEITEPDKAGHLLLIDLDDGNMATFSKRLKMLDELEPILSVVYKSSKTKGHKHALVTMKSRHDFEKRQMLELMLGSDPCRAIHNLRHHRNGSKYEEILSSPKGQWADFAFKDEPKQKPKPRGGEYDF